MSHQYAPLPGAPPQYAHHQHAQQQQYEVHFLPQSAIALKDFAVPPPPSFAYPAAAYGAQHQYVFPQLQQQELVPAAAPHEALPAALFVVPLVFGALSFVACWPLCLVGLTIAWYAMTRIRRDASHPSYRVVRAAVLLNVVSLVVGLVVLSVALVVMLLDWQRIMAALGSYAAGSVTATHRLVTASRAA